MLQRQLLDSCPANSGSVRNATCMLSSNEPVRQPCRPQAMVASASDAELARLCQDKMEAGRKDWVKSDASRKGGGMKR